MPDAIGIAFVFRQGDNGFPATATDAELVGDAAEQVLLTEIGERRHRPEFGSRLRSFLFEDIDEITLEAIKGEIEQALERNLDDDILITSIEVTAEEDSLGQNPTRVSALIQFDRQGRSGETTISLTP